MINLELTDRQIHALNKISNIIGDVVPKLIEFQKDPAAKADLLDSYLDFTNLLTHINNIIKERKKI